MVIIIARQGVNNLRGLKVKIKLKGQVRGGKNNMGITKTGRHYPNKKFAAWRDEMICQVNRQVELIKEFKQITGPCSIDITYTAGDKRRRDVPAILDALWHVFERSGVVKDDSLIGNVTFRKSYDKENPNVEIYLSELEEIR